MALSEIETDMLKRPYRKKYFNKHDWNQVST